MEVVASDSDQPLVDIACRKWVVHKFGGTSVGSADCMRRCIDIVRPHTKHSRVAFVVSAMGGKPKITDLLLDLVHAAAAGKIDVQNSKMEEIYLKHKVCAEDLLKSSPSRRERTIQMIESDLKDISDLLRAVRLMRTAHEQMLELVSGYGEIWSASLLAEVLQEEGQPFTFLNARDVLIVNEEEAVGTKVHWEESSSRLTEFLKNIPSSHLVITGYIASTPLGVATTLKRDGSDFSASIFGKLLNAESITIWTDVNGVYSADPRRVPEATVIPEVSYCEAIELAYFGAKVIHPKTMAPAIDAEIPIFIRNTFDPAHGGTRIYLTPGSLHARRSTVCGFTTIDGLSLLNLEGTGMIGVPGIAHRLFGALKAAHVPVLFIAQASSEHNICFATLSSHASRAKNALEEAFFYEQRCGFVSALRLVEGCSIIAAVGDGMSTVPGVAGLFFNALGGASISILSISMGCDERNIAAVVYTKEATRALRAVHSAFWLSSLDVNIAIVGTGRVGSALLQTLLEQAQVLEQRFGIKIALRAVANSRKMLLGEDLADTLKRRMRVFSMAAAGGGGVAGALSDGLRRSHSNLSLRDLEAVMASDGEGQAPYNLDAFVQHLRSAAGPHAIIVDATTSSAVAANHPAWLRAGCHVVTANKRALASSLDLYNAVFSSARAANRLYMSEVTIGASLPVRTTLNDLLCSGDAVYSIVGLMTVSIAVVLAYIEDGMTFAEAVAETAARGLFEDDPFLDLEGADAAAKLLILARELGFALRLEDIDVEPLAIRREREGTTLTLTREALEEGAFALEDERLQARIAAARARGCVLRYVQRIDCSPPAELGHRGDLTACRATVRLEEVPRDSELARVQGPVYHFAFHTARYSQNPLIVQGPLSDPANTASGIVGDILRIARSIGAKDRGPEILT